MLSGSPQCLFLIGLRSSLTFICPVYCVPYVARFSAVLIFDWPSWFPNVYLSCVLCTLCCQVLPSVYFWLALRGSLTFIYPVYCVPYVVRFSAVLIFYCPFMVPQRLFILCIVYPMLSGSPQCLFLIAPSWCPNVYLSCVLCTLCCQVLRSVYFWLPLRGSLTFIYPVYCVPYVVRFSAVFIFDCPFMVP